MAPDVETVTPEGVSRIATGTPGEIPLPPQTGRPVVPSGTGRPGQDDQTGVG